MKELSVASCHKCPMATNYWSSYTTVCEHPESTHSDADGRPKEFGYRSDVPDWCPLRKGPVTIRIHKES